MDFSFGFLFSSLLIGLLGTGLFMIGKRAGRPIFLVVSLLLMVYPFFVTNLVLMWAICGLLMVPLWVCRNA